MYIKTFLKNYIDIVDKSIYIMIRNDVRRKKSEVENLIRITCFSEINDNILMWSHYSDYHKGFCIEYDISKINPKDYRRHIFPVAYSDNCYDITQEMLHPIKDPIYIKSFLYKYKAWEYEKEWRLVCEEKPGFLEKEYKFDFSQVITGIYLGLHASIDKKELSELKKWAKEKNINLYKMKADDKQYKLHKEKID